MNTKLKRLSAACTGAVLLAACAGLGQRMAPEARPVQAAASANESYVLGRSQHMARRYEVAAASYMAALQADARHVNARNGLATLYAEQGDFSKAIPIWQQLTREAEANAGPETAFLFSNLGYAQFLSGAYDQALSALEKACVLDPLNHRAWRRLGSALDKLGQVERAQLMYRQAEALEKHDVKADYALAQQPVPAAIGKALQAAPRAHDAWAATEVRQVASGMYELHRVPAAAVAAVQPAPSTQEQALLEIRNGNGITGMARALSRQMDRDTVRVVRLSNQRPFDVRQTRVEYQPAFRETAERLAERFGNATVVEVANCKSADMRLVIGRDIIHREFALRPVVRGLLATFVESQTRLVRARDNGDDLTPTP
ncbi:LytR C-terminal domain-containing protein [Massilia cavernae]|nr:LytR C-terminal domain-containing protein [Massilia cavernae]